ncbi:MAG: response regulator transcription factor [Armatimonadota bacterium]
MEILVVDDDAVLRTLLKTALTHAGYEVLSASSGAEAAQLWQEHDARLLLTDWLMPGMDGEALCQHIRGASRPTYTYIIMLTAQDSREALLAGLAAGADDYLTKPYDAAELLMRVKAGVRVLDLQEALQARVQELETAVGRIQTLEEILPICSYCKQIRDEEGTWHQVEVYIHDHTDTDFSHSICPKCMEVHHGDLMRRFRRAQVE